MGGMDECMKECIWYRCNLWIREPGKLSPSYIQRLGVAQCPTHVFKKVTQTLRWFAKEKGSRQNQCMMHMRKAQHVDVHSTTIFTNKYKQKGTWHLCMAVWKMARNMFAPCPYFRDLQGRELRGLLVIFPKVIISLLMVSRGIVPFEEHIASVGTTSNNMLSKRKTLDEGSL